MCIFIWRFFCFFNICLQFKMLKLFPDSFSFFLSISLKVAFFYCSSTFTLQIFLISVPILHHRIPSPCGDWRGRCPKLKGPNVPYMLQNIGIQPNPQKCQTANSNKCQITLFALGFAKYVQDVLSSLQFHLPQRHQFILSISARYKFLILEGNQISLLFGQKYFGLQMSTNLLHSKRLYL